MGDIPTIYEFLGLLDFLRGPPSAYAILITSAVILIVRDWRWSLLALVVQYLVVGLLFAEVLPPLHAFTKVLVGAFIGLILYITARQVNWGRLPEDITEDEAVQLGEERFVRFGSYMLPTDTPFRVFLALIVALSVWALTQRADFRLPALSEPLNLAVLALIGMGLVTLSLTSEPLKAGMGLLTFLTGVELFYSAVEQSVVMLTIMSIADLFIVLVIAYLVQARHSFSALLE